MKLTVEYDGEKYDVSPLTVGQFEEIYGENSTLTPAQKNFKTLEYCMANAGETKRIAAHSPWPIFAKLLQACSKVNGTGEEKAEAAKPSVSQPSAASSLLAPDGHTVN